MADSAPWEVAGFGLYVHWPFCAAKCPYCDFNSHVAAKIDAADWIDAYIREIRRVAALTGPRQLDSIFFGGGTPSLMSPEIVERVIATASSEWALALDAEITLEANPTSVEGARLRDFRSAGVNRLSMGIQSLRDSDLRRLGRTHSAAEAMGALGIARRTFDRVSFDLIYARQHQSLADWETELSEAIALDPDHLSLYQLTIEDGTVFGARHAAGRLSGLPDEGLASDMYHLTQSICRAAGLPAYEVSNHARLGSEGRHNLIYWRSGDWAGIGPGAHGRLTIGAQRVATSAVRDPAEWKAGVRFAGSAEAETENLDCRAQGEEYILMAMRLREGISMTRHQAISGTRLDPVRLAALEEMDLVCIAGDRVRATDAGVMVLNEVLRRMTD
jgi:putative oxygen-independent coproporphyrinogen III oxidase